MVSDATTFFAAFSAVFGLLALYLWRIERHARRLEERVALVESSAANDKKPEDPPGGTPP